MTDFEHRVQFQPGYNYLHEKGPNRRGQHGMTIRFVLIGPEGAAEFILQTFWTPLGEVDKNARREFEPVHIDYWREDQFGTFGMVNPPTGSFLGYHWPTPQYEGERERECDVLPGGKCHYGGSGVEAEVVLRVFISEGDAAVWRWLEKRYQWCLDDDKETST